MTLDPRVFEVAEGMVKVAPVPLASFFASMSPNELAGFVTAVIGAIYGLAMLAYLLRKWQREEVLFKQSLQVIQKGSRRRVAEKINALTL